MPDGREVSAGKAWPPHYSNIKLGEADTIENLLPDQLAQLDTGLRKSGLLLMDDKKSILVERT